MKTKQKKALVALISLSILVLTCTWSVLAEDGLVPEPRSDLSLEGIWTTMTPTPAGTSAIMSLIINAQSSEGMVYTCVGKHPECSVSAYGLSPEAEKVSDLLGYLVRTGANTFRFSVICHGIKQAGPELLDIGETLYMVTLTGTAELIDSGTMIINEFTYAAYLPTQDLDGDRLPDEGVVPVICATIPQLPFKRLPMFPSCEPTPIVRP
jgi:hypothetical protein